MARPRSGRHNGDIPRRAPAEIVRQQGRALVGLLRQPFDLQDLDLLFDAVDEDDCRDFRFALDLKRIEAGELEVGTEVAAHVRVHHGAGGGGDSGDDTLAGTRINGRAAEGAGGDADGVFRVVPSGAAFHRVPEEPQVEALSSHEDVFHLLGHGFDGDILIGEVDVKGLVRVSFLYSRLFVTESLHLTSGKRTHYLTLLLLRASRRAGRAFSGTGLRGCIHSRNRQNGRSLSKQHRPASRTDQPRR